LEIYSTDIDIGGSGLLPSHTYRECREVSQHVVALLATQGEGGHTGERLSVEGGCTQ